MIGAAANRALGSLRRRPGPTLSAAAGLLLVGVLAGTAATTGVALATGFDRAQRAADTADVIAHFDAVTHERAEERLGPLANIRERSYRIVLRPIGVEAFAGGDFHYVEAEVNGLEAGHERDGLALVAGRPLGAQPGEIVVERGLAQEWGIGVGDAMEVGRMDVRVVGIAVEPDNVAYPLAARPRVYIRAVDARDQFMQTGTRYVNAAYLRLADRDRLPETLVQARVATYGVRDLTFTSRAGVRSLVEEAGGLVAALLVAFAVIALIAAGTMLAAAGHARVTRDLATIGVLRALGFSPGALAASYALEAALVAAPAAALGVVIGALLVHGPTANLLYALNELPPPHALGWAHLAALLAIVAIAAAAGGWPAYAAARRPVVESLHGARTTPPRRAGAVGRPFALGARLAAARPVRLAAAAAAVAAAVATILLLLALARFLIDAQREPSAIGERYSLVARGPDALRLARGTPGVAAAAERAEVRAVDAFDLGEPLALVAFGAGGSAVFPGRALLDGERARAPGDVEVGRGLAQSLGLGVGGRLLAELEDGGEVSLRVTGIVQELARDGRVAYTDLATVRAALPGLTPEVAVRPQAGVGAATVRERLEARGLDVRENAGLAPAGAPFVGTIVALLRVVAIADGLICAAIVLLALLVLARERAQAIAVLRVSGATPRQVVTLLAGASLALLALALPLGYLLERAAFAPLLSRVAERYGALALAPTAADVALVALGAAAIALVTAAGTARRLSRAPVVDVLHSE